MIRTYTLDLLVSREAGNVSQTLRSLTTPALPNSNSLEISTSNRTNYFSWRRVNSCSLQPEATLFARGHLWLSRMFAGYLVSRSYLDRAPPKASSNPQGCSYHCWETQIPRIESSPWERPLAPTEVLQASFRNRGVWEMDKCVPGILHGRVDQNLPF